MGEKILLVDDDPKSLKNVAELLRDEGYEVDEAQNGDEAAQRLSIGRFDLVLSDLIMSGGNGLYLLKRMRSNTPGLPVLIMSGFPNIDPAELVELGATDFITKPLVFEQLLSRIKRALEERAEL